MTEETAGTPRTDAGAWIEDCSRKGEQIEVVRAKLARKLEKEVAALTTQREAAGQAYKTAIREQADQLQGWKDRAEAAEAQRDEQEVAINADRKWHSDKINELRAELDAAKRALAEEQAKNESLRDALVYSGFMQHETQRYMLPVGIGLLNNDWVVVTFPDKSKVDTGPRPRAFEMMRIALAAKSTEQEAEDGPTLYTPLEPTDFMLRAGRSAMRKRHPKHAELSHPMSQVRMIYKAMIVAALADGQKTEAK